MSQAVFGWLVLLGGLGGVMMLGELGILLVLVGMAGCVRIEIKRKFG